MSDFQPARHDPAQNSDLDLSAILRRDVQRYSDSHRNIVLAAMQKMYSHPSLMGVIYYRIGRWLLAGKRNPFYAMLFLVHRIAYPLVRMYSGLELSPRANIGPGLCIMHFGRLQ